MPKFLLHVILVPIALACANPPWPPDPPVLLPRAASNPPRALWPSVPPGLAFSAAPWPMSANAAEQILTASEGYLLGEGMASDMNEFPTAFIAFNIILDQPDSVPIFERVGNNGTPAGQLWALSGLKLRNAATAKPLQSRLRQSKESVWSGLGCVLVKVKVGELADDVGDGKPQTWLRAGRNPSYSYLDELANKRLNASASSGTGVAVATPVPAVAAR